MLVYGYGGHAKVIIDCLEAVNEPVQGIFDDYKSAIEEYSFLGKYNRRHFVSEKLIVAIGNNAIRKNLTSLIQHDFGNVIHPSALISKKAQIGKGTVIFHRAVIQANAHIGQHVIINTGAIVEHDCKLDDYVHIAPAATLCGTVRVGEETLIGAGAIVLPNLKIGKNCIIGAGCVVRKDVHDFTILK